MIEPDLAAAREWPRPLPVVLSPARDEALSSWLARHATFYGLGITSMRRHCVPDALSLPGLDRELTPDQEARLAHLFRRDPVAIRKMLHVHLGSAVSQLVARAVDHRCEPCARLLVADGHAEALPRSWFHTWRISCERCGSPVVSASKAPWTALPDLFPHLWSAALKGEQLLSGAVDRATPATSALPTTVLRVLMISTARDAIPEHGGRTLDAVIPGFNATLDRHGIAIPFTSLIDVPLPVRTALLAGLAFAMEEAHVAIPAIWNATSGMHRTHLGFVLTELAAGLRPHDCTIAEVGRVLAARFAVYGRTAVSHSASSNDLGSPSTRSLPHRSRARKASILEFHNCSIFDVERRMSINIKCSKRRKQVQYHNYLQRETVHLTIHRVIQGSLYVCQAPAVRRSGVDMNNAESILMR